MNLVPGHIAFFARHFAPVAFAMLAFGFGPAAVAASAATPTQTAAASAGAGPQLTAERPSHDFGTVAQGTVVRHEFRVTNTGREGLEIRNVDSSCGCTTVGSWPKALQPGESGTIAVQLDTAQFVGPIVKVITVTSTDPRQETVLELKANVWTPVVISHPVLVFPPATDPSAPATRTVTLRSEIEEPLTLSEPVSENPAFTARLREIAPGKSFELNVTTVPPLPEGTQTGKITMKSTSEKVPVVSVQAVATVLPPIQTAPAEFPFQTAKLAAPEKRYAVVLNRRNFDLQVTDVTTNAPGVTVSTTMSDDGKQFTAALSFPAGFELRPGDKYWLRGKTNHPKLPTFEIPIVFTGSR